MQEEYYMCKVDFEHHLEGDFYGTTVYNSLESLEHHRSCTKQCGIVKVKIQLIEVVKPTDYSSLR